MATTLPCNTRRWGWNSQSGFFFSSSWRTIFVGGSERWNGEMWCLVFQIQLWPDHKIWEFFKKHGILTCNLNTTIVLEHHRVSKQTPGKSCHCVYHYNCLKNWNALLICCQTHHAQSALLHHRLLVSLLLLFWQATQAVNYQFPISNFLSATRDLFWSLSLIYDGLLCTTTPCFIWMS